MNCVAIIPARGGSTRIPRKNIRDFHGKPIIAYAIETAMESGLFDKIFVSTEDIEIMKVAEKYGAEVQPRPVELCEDHIGTQKVMQYAMKCMPYCGYACCLYPCSPLITVHDLRISFSILKEKISTTIIATIPSIYFIGLFISD